MICWARYLFLALVAVLATGHMLAACGQKGPLYLPENAPEPVTATAPGRPNAEAEAVDDLNAPDGGPPDAP